MAKSYTKLEQALKDLIESYAEVELELEEKHSDDEEALGNELLEVLEGSIETALEEHDFSAGSFANLLSVLSEGLEQIDPAAFEDEGEEDEEDEEYEMSDVDYDDLEEGDLDEDDMEEYDEEDEDEDDDE